MQAGGSRSARRRATLSGLPESRTDAAAIFLGLDEHSCHAAVAPEGLMRCIRCKGKGLCGLPRCPITSRFLAQAEVKPSANYQGTAPSVFVGSFGYPDVQGGPLLIDDSDHPPDWLARNLRIEDVVGIRPGRSAGDPRPGSSPATFRRSPSRHDPSMSTSRSPARSLLR